MSTKLNRRAILAGRRCLQSRAPSPIQGSGPGRVGSGLEIRLRPSRLILSSLKRIRWRVAVPARSIACHRMG
jgi:hypothetical protein